jgi:hypothetical protein
MFDVARAVEWLTWKDRRDVAVEHARWWLAENPNIDAPFRRALAAAREGALRLDSSSGFAEDLARTIYAYDLDEP